MMTRFWKLFGSLKLAVLLLTVLAVVMAVATVYEARTSSRAALLNIYQSWWFNALLGLLALNIAAATVTRWPWKRKHIGFVVTHAGLIVMLIGCSAQFHYGTEGMLDLRVGHPPTNLVRLSDETLTLIVAETGLQHKTPVRIRNDGSIRPASVRVAKNLQLNLEQFLPNTEYRLLVEEGGGAPNPALQFRLHSELAGLDHTDWLVAASPEHNRAAVGPAQIEFVVAGDADSFAALMAEPGKQGERPQPALLIEVAGATFRFNIAEQLQKPLQLADTGVQAHIAGYWPDFRLGEDHKPTTVSDQPNNPAAVVILSRGEDEQRYFVFADPQMPPIVRTTRGRPIDAEVRLSSGPRPASSGLFRVVLAPDGTLHYAVNSRQGFRSGALPLGEPIAPGWMDFAFTARKFVANAVVSHRVVAAEQDPEGGFPALRVRARLGTEEATQWVRFGEPAVMELGGQTLHLLYGWDRFHLPFTVALEDFVIERDEGSMNVAGWTSHVVFHDAARGLTQRASIWMNHPAWFGGYKFAQASWNPNDPHYSALQVKRDPKFVTWLTWSGAALIVGGIAMMFYMRGWLQRGNGPGEASESQQSKAKELVST